MPDIIELCVYENVITVTLLTAGVAQDLVLILESNLNSVHAKLCHTRVILANHPITSRIVFPT